MRKDQTARESIYTIKVKGILDRSWSTWFDTLKIMCLDNRVTQLKGNIPDQSALFGILTKIHNMGLFLLEVKYIDNERKEYGKENNNCGKPGVSL